MAAAESWRTRAPRTSGASPARTPPALRQPVAAGVVRHRADEGTVLRERPGAACGGPVRLAHAEHLLNDVPVRLGDRWQVLEHELDVDVRLHTAQ
eukprot:3623972-Alexandrium_andersonii.AAC.1